VAPDKKSFSSASVTAIPRLNRSRFLTAPPVAGELGTPLLLSFSGNMHDVSRFVVEQQDGHGHRTGPSEITLVPNVGAQLVPELLGDVLCRYWVTLRNGSIVSGRFRMQVEMPSKAVSLFRTDSHYRSIRLEGAGARFQLHPVVRFSSAPALNPDTEILYPWMPLLYPNGGTPFSIDGHVKFHVQSDAALPAIEVSDDGTVVALRTGFARIQASFGSATDSISVVVTPGAN
jgi:hypothetical protein